MRAWLKYHVARPDPGSGADVRNLTTPMSFSTSAEGARAWRAVSVCQAAGYSPSSICATAVSSCASTHAGEASRTGARASIAPR